MSAPASPGPIARAIRFIRMAGTSIAAYYARLREVRQADDLRLAFCILTTRWHRGAGVGCT